MNCSAIARNDKLETVEKADGGSQSENKIKDKYLECVPKKGRSFIGLIFWVPVSEKKKEQYTTNMNKGMNVRKEWKGRVWLLTLGISYMFRLKEGNICTNIEITYMYITYSMYINTNIYL